MSVKTEEELEQELYPDCDGQPMADNTLQFQWIVTLQGNLDALFRDDPNVFVGGDLLWYAVYGEPKIRTAPDVLVVFGRPKGYRGSYRQWREDGIAPHVVFEVLSPGNRDEDMASKFDFYERYGVEEYYLYDPEAVVLSGWLRKENVLQAIEPMHGWVSPRLGIRFDLSGEELVIFRGDSERFLTFLELKEEQERERQRADEERLHADEARQDADEARRHAEEARQREDRQRRHADEARQHAEEARQHAEEARQHAEEARQHAKEERQRANEEHQRAEEERQRAERLAAQLRALGIEPEA